MKTPATINMVVHFSIILFLALFLAGCENQEKPVSRDTGSVSYHIGMGRAFYHLGNYKKAIEMYEKAAELDPRSLEAYLKLGIIYDDNLKDEEKAIEYYRRFLELAPASDTAERVRKWMAESQKELNVKERTTMLEQPVPSPLPPAGPGESAPVVEKPPRVICTPVTRSASPRAFDAGATSEPVLYAVRQSDTLAKIAARVYQDRGEWRRIYEANRDRLGDPDDLRPGQLLIIPPRGQE